MSQQFSALDRRFLKAVGITEEESPVPMVSGETYQRVIDQNDELVTENHKLRAELERVNRTGERWLSALHEAGDQIAHVSAKLTAARVAAYAGIASAVLMAGLAIGAR